MYQIGVALNSVLKTVCPRFSAVFAFEADDWAAGRLTVDVYEQNPRLTILYFVNSSSAAPWPGALPCNSEALITAMAT